MVSLFKNKIVFFHQITPIDIKMLCPCQGPSVHNVPRTNFEVDFEPAGANMKTTCGSMSCSAVNPKLGTKCGIANTNGYQVNKNNRDS